MIARCLLDRVNEVLYATSSVEPFARVNPQNIVPSSL